MILPNPFTLHLLHCQAASKELKHEPASVKMSEVVWRPLVCLQLPHQDVLISASLFVNLNQKNWSRFTAKNLLLSCKRLVKPVKPVCGST